MLVGSGRLEMSNQFQKKGLVWICKTGSLWPKTIVYHQADQHIVYRYLYDGGVERVEVEQKDELVIEASLGL